MSETTAVHVCVLYRCVECAEHHPRSEFYSRKTSKRGLLRRVKTCRSCVCARKREQYDPERASRRYRAVRDTDPARFHAWWGPPAKLRFYGLNQADVDRMLADQDGRCAICRKDRAETGPLQVDHDHVTGVVRGMLCGQCNRGLGQLGDTAEALQRAVDYLARSEATLSV